MHEDIMVTFTNYPDYVLATVIRRTYPGGRQRRHEVAAYRMTGLPEVPSPLELLAALSEALTGPPAYVL